MKIIDSFRGDYFFLSNFYLAPVIIGEITYQNNETAFQAQKCKTDEEKMRFASISDPGTAKKEGKRIKGLDIAQWTRKRIMIMKNICLAKFLQNPDLKEKLLSTGDAELVEGNTWNDTFWGVNSRTGKGDNNLGKILMNVRQTMHLIEERKLKYVKVVISDGVIIENSYSPEDKKKLLEYMSSFEKGPACGLVFDLKKNDNTSVENIAYLDDNGFCWETTEIYHLEKYGAKLSEEFTEFALHITEL